MPVHKDTSYVHYKNGEKYLVVDTAINPNTNETIVLYREWGDGPKLYQGQLYWRPILEFLDKFRRRR